MYIKVPKSGEFASFDEDEVILFPFFPYEVISRDEAKGECIVKEITKLKKNDMAGR